MKCINDKFEDKCMNSEIGRVSVDNITTELSQIESEYKKIVE
jgi:hypothetical protein